MDDDKINVPEDFPGTGDGGPETPKNEVEKDPEVLAEIKKNKLLHLKLERWKETAGALGVVLQTFKAEAMSLTSGIGTLVIGWFQIRKVVARGRAETKAEGRIEGRAEGRIAGRAAERAERREDRMGTTRAESRPAKPKPVATMPPPGGELMPVELTASMPTSPYLDPMNYVTVMLPMVFIWSSVVAWLKRKRKNQNKEDRRV